MVRPLWVWFVFIVSIFFAGTGVLSGSMTLFLALNQQTVTELMERMRPKVEELQRQYPEQPSEMNFDEVLAAQAKLSSNPYYKIYSVIAPLLKVLLAVGFFIGAIQLIRLKGSGVTLLSAVYLADLLFLLLSSAASWLYMPQSLSGMPSDQFQNIVLICSVIFWAALDVIPLMCLKFGSKGAFAEE
jgi:hypothetical protein